MKTSLKRGLGGKLSYRELLVFSLPSILATLLEPLASLVDTAFVGRLHTDWLAALAVASIILNSFSWIFNFLIHATIQGVSAANVEGHTELLQERVRISLYTALGVGVVCTFLVWVSRFFWYAMAGASGDLVGLVDSYFQCRLLGQPFFILYTTLLSVLRGLGRIYTSFFLVALTTGANILLTYILLYGQKMGLVGAAFGTVLANILGLCVCLIIVIREPLLSGVFGKLSVTKHHWFVFGKNGIDLFFRKLALTLVFFLSTRLSALLGVKSLAAHQVVLQIYLFSSYFIDGLATSANILGANLFAAKKMSDLRIIFKRILHLGILCGFLCTVVYFFWGEAFVRLFTQDGAVISLCLGVLPVIYLTQTISSLSFTYDGIMFGLGEFAYLRKHIVLGLIFFFLPLALSIFYFESLWCIWSGIVALNVYRWLALAKRTRDICQ